MIDRLHGPRDAVMRAIAPLMAEAKALNREIDETMGRFARLDEVRPEGEPSLLAGPLLAAAFICLPLLAFALVTPC